MVPFAQTRHVQPVLVELEARRQNVGNRLVQARDEQASNFGFTHPAESLITPNSKLQTPKELVFGV